jgi:hypothetical protein
MAAISTSQPSAAGPMAADVIEVSATTGPGAYQRAVRIGLTS